MNEISPEQLLSQIRTLGRDLQPNFPVQPAPQGDAGFGNLLKDSLSAVNEAQQTSTQLKTDFLNGASDKTLAEVMLASNKASLQFQAVVEVRNKLVTAYQDIMNMPV